MALENSSVCFCNSYFKFDILSSIQYLAENLIEFPLVVQACQRICSSKPCGFGYYEKNANKTRGAETRLGQEASNDSCSKAEQEEGTEPSIQCSSSWLFLGRLLN